MSTNLKVWFLKDSKIGHEKQGQALLNFLNNHFCVESESFDISKFSWIDFLLEVIGAKPLLSAIKSKPDLIIGVGRRTHLPMLLARKRHGGKTIVIMKPSLPILLFDLCIIPRHDNPPFRDNVIITNGPISGVETSRNLDQKLGLILLGGPSKHFEWSNSRVMKQIVKILERTNKDKIKWKLSSSRRTPEELIQNLEELNLDNLTIIPFKKTYKGWLEETLKTHGQVWVSMDSLSMIYEALQSGGKVVLVGMKEARKRVSLLGKKTKISNLSPMPTTFSEWLRTQEIRKFSLPKDFHQDWQNSTKTIITKWLINNYKNN